MFKYLESIFKRGFWVVILAWIFVIYNIRDLFGFYSADSYAFYFLGHSIITGQGYIAPAIRDLYLDPNGPLVSRSYPPLFPLLIGITDFFLQKKIAAGTIINLFIGIFGLYLWFIIARRLSNYLFFIPFTIPILCTFVPYDHALWRDALAGRSSTLTLLLFFATLLLLSRSTLLTDNKIPIGVGIILGLLTLTRFDAILFCFALPAVIFITTPLRFKKTLFMYGSLILVMLPWAIRNYLAFGSFLASDNALTVASTAVGIGSLTFFEHGPPLGIDNPEFWLAQRITYLKGNIGYVFSLLTTEDHLGKLDKPVSIMLTALTLLYVPGFIFSFITRKQNYSLWIYFIAGLTWCVVNIFCIALTPYMVDARYYVVTSFVIMGGSAFFIVICIRKIFNSRLKNLFSPDIKKPRTTTILAESLLCIMIVFVTIYLYSKELYHNQHDIAWEWTSHIKNAPVKKGELVVAIDAEKVAYYTGWNTIYLPNNTPLLPESVLDFDVNQPAWKNYRAWLKRWKPSYLLVEVWDFYNPLAEYPHATALTILDTMVLLKINLDESALTKQDAVNDTDTRELWKQTIILKIPSPTTFFENNVDFENGVAIHWDGFYVPNIPENQKKFAQGRVVLLPNGEQRLINKTYFIKERWYVQVQGGPIPTVFFVPANYFQTIDGDGPDSFFITNQEWVRGVAVKWAGFMMQNTPENRQHYRIGYTVQLPTGEERTITDIKTESLMITVHLNGMPMDGYKVGTPDHFTVTPK